MKITLKRITIRNFKGIQDLALDNLDQTTDLGGDNGTGKSTFLDAYLWNLFGKDSVGRADFQVKTLQPDNEPIHHLEHSVELEFVIDDGRTITMRREYREKWVKKRGNSEPDFTGHEQTFFWNDIPMKAGEYAARVSELIEEETFKLLSNPHYFNSLDWKKRREILFALDGGVITDADIAAGSLEFQALLHETRNKTFDDYRKEIGVKKKKIKDEIDHIPARIEELERMRPGARDWSILRAQLAAEEEDIRQIEAQQADESKAMKVWADGRKEVQHRLYDLQRQHDATIAGIRSDIDAEQRERTKDVNEWRLDLSRISNRQSRLTEEFAAAAKAIEDAEGQRAKLREEWMAVNASEFHMNPESTKCPTCHQGLPDDMLENQTATLTGNFNTAKTRKLDEINSRGRRYKEQAEYAQRRQQEISAEMSGLNAQYLELDGKIKDFEAKDHNQVNAADLLTIRMQANLSLQDLIKQIEAVKAELDGLQEFTPDPELSAKKSATRAEIDRLKAELTDEDRIRECNTRIAELKNQQKKQAQELARLEGLEFTMLEFMKAKVARIEDSINRHFHLVRFKMFKTNINGGEEECCDTLIDGVPWREANNAGRINGGLDIIRALSEFYNISAPVIIDNAESVNRLYALNSQIIRLSVTLDKVLTNYTQEGPIPLKIELRAIA